jgi:hypothetical protein
MNSLRQSMTSEEKSALGNDRVFSRPMPDVKAVKQLTSEEKSALGNDRVFSRPLPEENNTCCGAREESGDDEEHAQE